ncbi:hypothetical protein, partial [Escherichia coli]
LLFAFSRSRKRPAFDVRFLALKSILLIIIRTPFYYFSYYYFTGTVAKLAMRQPFVLFKGLTFQKLCLPGAFRPGDHHNKMLRP